MAKTIDEIKLWVALTLQRNYRNNKNLKNAILNLSNTLKAELDYALGPPCIIDDSTLRRIRVIDYKPIQAKESDEVIDVEPEDEVLDEKKLNQEAMKIMTEKGAEKAMEFMFNPTGKKRLSYSEMRMYFG